MSIDCLFMLMICKFLLLEVHDKGLLTTLCPTSILTIDVHLIALKDLEDSLTKLDFPCDSPRFV